MRTQDTLYITAGLEARNHAYERYVFDGSRRIARLGVARPSEGSAAESTTLLYVPDHLGSNAIVVMDQSSTSSADIGAIVSTASHLPYGGIEAESGAEIPGHGIEMEAYYRFSGKEHEAGLGIYYFGARYHNPQTCTFLSVDAVVLFGSSASNAYLYVGGRVYHLVDPDGNQAVTAGGSNTIPDEIANDFANTREYDGYTLIGDKPEPRANTSSNHVQSDKGDVLR